MLLMHNNSGKERQTVQKLAERLTEHIMDSAGVGCLGYRLYHWKLSVFWLLADVLSNSKDYAVGNSRWIKERILW